MNRMPAGPLGPAHKSTDRSRRLIALDWGTSSLRAYLLGRHGKPIQERTKPWGIMRVPDSDFARAFHAVVLDWLQSCPGLPVIAAGMVGSSQGWREVAYQHCPAGLGSLASGLEEVHVGGDVRLYIVPGVIQAGPPPNVMRGEETQIIGSLAREPSLQTRARLIMPGTHSKWVEVRNGEIDSFVTYMTGELFAVLRDHSILGRPARDARSPDDVPDVVEDLACWSSFERGLIAARQSDQLGVMPLLFSARTLVLTGGIRPLESLDYLSGLLIGEELRCGLASKEGREHAPLALVGDGALCERYRRALHLFGVTDLSVIHGTSTAGLWRIAIEAGLAEEDDAPAGEEAIA